MRKHKRTKPNILDKMLESGEGELNIFTCRLCGCHNKAIGHWQCVCGHCNHISEADVGTGGFGIVASDGDANAARRRLFGTLGAGARGDNQMDYEYGEDLISMYS